MRYAKPVVSLVVAGLSLLAGPPPARAHCDTMDGPVAVSYTHLTLPTILRV